MNSVIDLGFISIHWYSIILLIAIFVGYRIVAIEGKKWNVPEDFMFNLIFVALVFGIIGARLYYVLFNFDYYSNDPIEILKVWNGGLAIHGGIICGLLAIIFYCKKYNANLMRILDILVVGLILAQAIGRWGNFFNGEAHGPAVTLDYLQSLHLPDFIINGMYIDGIYYMPTFLFESMLCLLGFIVLLFFRRRRYNKVGQTTAFYLIWYGIVRFFIESMRTDSLMFMNFKIAQIVSLLMVFVGLIIYIKIGKKGNKFDNLYNDVENTQEIKF